MSLAKLTSCCALSVAVLLLAASTAPAAEKLSDILQESGWEGIIGTWVDADTNGANVKITYAWRFEDRLIEIKSTMGPTEAIGLMGVNGKTGEVFHMGANSQGGSSHGKWNVDEKGDAILGLEYVSHDGQEGTLSIRHHREDNNTVIMTIEVPELIEIKLIRQKSAE